MAVEILPRVTPRIKTARTFREQYGLDGYTPCAPDQKAHELDKSICDEAFCDKCGNLGLHYRPFTLFADTRSYKADSYRAFAICLSCRHVEEF